MFVFRLFVVFRLGLICLFGFLLRLFTGLFFVHGLLFVFRLFFIFGFLFFLLCGSLCVVNVKLCRERDLLEILQVSISDVEKTEEYEEQ